MYITGTSFNLKNRLHQFCQEESDYSSYEAELPLAESELSEEIFIQLEREFQKRLDTISED